MEFFLDMKTNYFMKNLQKLYTFYYGDSLINKMQEKEKNSLFFHIIVCYMFSDEAVQLTVLSIKSQSKPEQL